MYKICQNGIFKSIQGEGAHTGESAVFIRFFGCNRMPPCSFCDETCKDFQEMSLNSILEEIKRMEPFSILVLTGGEPTIQPGLDELIEAFHKQHYYVSIETNGLAAIPANIDWITCSPKQNYVHDQIKNVDELKFVVADTKETILKLISEITKKVSYKKLFLQPVSNQPESVQTCLELIERHPTYLLSLQIHKLIHIQ